MPRALKRIAFVLEEFALRTPAQQLLDRFLAGYPREGAFHRLEKVDISVHVASGAAGNADIERRVRDFGLRVRPNLSEAVAEADAVVVAWRGRGAEANEALLREVLQRVPASAPVFVCGALANSLAAAREFRALAATRQTLAHRMGEGDRRPGKGLSTGAISDIAPSGNLALLSGTATAVTYRLPDIDLPSRARVKEALIVVQGPTPDAELDALEGLLPILERRRGGETGVASVRYLEGEGVWRAREERQWPERLLVAAISRSDSPQGDPVKDGRTQDIVGLGLVPGLARNPRGWLLRHRDGVRTAILVLDGVVADNNFAVATADGAVISAQLYRPAEPAQAHFNLLAAAVEDFFRSGRAPWPPTRDLLVAGLLGAFRSPESRSGRVFATPDLRVG
ncbi:MAG: hypothetical protein KGS61_14600 [Verrucomicrobia bacterium]|nr:hypothetical protein [Verrucomicrobiota bacterium]